MEAPAASDAVPVFTLAIVTVMPLSAIWNTLGKLLAAPVPMLEAVAENDSLWPVTREDGAMAVSPAVRSGRSTAHAAVALHVLDDAEPEQMPLPPVHVCV